MTLMGQALEYHRLRAPREQGGTLIDPPASAVGELIERNAALRAGSQINLQGRPLEQLAREAREQLVEEAWRYTRAYRDVPRPVLTPATPVLLAGHQPQLFHPGVWYKNFVLSALARREGAIGVNLAIDSDTIKSAAARVPSGTAAEPAAQMVPFDRPTAEIPYEERSIVDRGCLASFGERAAETIKDLVPDPFVRQFWPLVIERSRAVDNLGECLAQARHQQEERWGALTYELPQSRICNLEAFHWFTCHLLARLPRLREVYNGAVAEFRRANHVRSTAHPVPDLAASDDWLEAPYWIWHRDRPRRQRLFVRQRGQELILTDRGEIEIALRLSPDGDARGAVEQLAALSAQGIKLRTRALVTTLFARLMLSDLFLHGIGGAKYDQVTDLMVSRFFGLEPPAYLTVTATLRLPIRRPEVSEDDAQLVERRLRELTYHPERWFDPAAAGPDAQRSIDVKRQWIATPQTRDNARQRCREIRQANESLQPCVAREREHLQAERDDVAQALKGAAILASREFAFCLYPEGTLRELLEKGVGDRG